jgi:hypothetical protein
MPTAKDRAALRNRQATEVEASQQVLRNNIAETGAQMTAVSDNAPS